MRLIPTSAALVAILAPLTASPAVSQPPANFVYQAGIVVDTPVIDRAAILISVGPADPDSVDKHIVELPCPPDKFPGCLDLVNDDEVRFFGHLGLPQPGCGIQPSIDNPLVADDIQRCDKEGCTSL
jgi:hypothetical protein